MTAFCRTKISNMTSTQTEDNSRAIIHTGRAKPFICLNEATYSWPPQPLWVMGKVSVKCQKQWSRMNQLAVGRACTGYFCSCFFFSFERRSNTATSFNNLRFCNHMKTGNVFIFSLKTRLKSYYGQKTQ